MEINFCITNKKTYLVLGYRLLPGLIRNFSYNNIRKQNLELNANAYVSEIKDHMSYTVNAVRFNRAELFFSIVCFATHMQYLLTNSLIPQEERALVKMRVIYLFIHSIMGMWQTNRHVGQQELKSTLAGAKKIVDSIDNSVTSLNDAHMNSLVISHSYQNFNLPMIKFTVNHAKKYRKIVEYLSAQLMNHPDLCWPVIHDNVNTGKEIYIIPIAIQAKDLSEYITQDCLLTRRPLMGDPISHED